MTSYNFIDRCIKIHKNKYIYDKVIYNGLNSIITIICPEHGDFNQVSSAHLYGSGCKSCMCRLLRDIKSNSLINIINRFNERHNSIYDYSLVKYINLNTKVEIKCNLHGSFWQTPKNHLKHGCSKCSGNHHTIVSELEDKLRSVHGDKYRYDFESISELRSKSKISIYCYDHGEFRQTINNHLNIRQGCPKCKMSKGQSEIHRLLTENSIKFESEFSFEGCFYKSRLRFDFWLPDKNIAIEFDGLQHTKPIELFGGDEYLNYIKTCDGIKNDWCSSNKIELIRISKISEIKSVLKNKYII